MSRIVCVCVCVQLKAWEEYTSKLEEKYVALMAEHEAFQRELASVRGILDDGTDAQIHGTYPTMTLSFAALLALLPCCCCIILLLLLVQAQESQLCMIKLH